MSRPASVSGPVEQHFVGAQSAGVIALAAGFWIFALVVVGPFQRWDTPVNHLAAALIFGSIMGFLAMAASARAFIRGDDLVLVSFFVTNVIPLREIVELVDDNGFSVRVVSGRTLGSMAFGPSLIAMLTGNRRGRRAANRLRALRGPFGETGRWDQDTAQTTVRTGAIAFALGLTMLVAVYAMLGSVT